MTPVNNMGCVTKSLSGTKVLKMTTTGDTSITQRGECGTFFSFIDILILFYQMNLHIKRNTFCITLCLKNVKKYANDCLIQYV